MTSFSFKHTYIRPKLIYVEIKFNHNFKLWSQSQNLLLLMRKWAVHVLRIRTHKATLPDSDTHQAINTYGSGNASIFLDHASTFFIWIRFNTSRSGYTSIILLCILHTNTSISGYDSYTRSGYASTSPDPYQTLLPKLHVVYIICMRQCNIRASGFVPCLINGCAFFT
jgi:hypothetical protein